MTLRNAPVNLHERQLKTKKCNHVMNIIFWELVQSDDIADNAVIPKDLQHACKQVFERLNLLLDAFDELNQGRGI